MKQDLELAKRTHELHCLQLEEQIYETKIESQKKLQEIECLLTVSKKKVEELESLSESKSQRWKRIEHSYQSFMGCQLGVIQVCFNCLFLHFWCIDAYSSDMTIISLIRI